MNQPIYRVAFVATVIIGLFLGGAWLEATILTVLAAGAIAFARITPRA